MSELKPCPFCGGKNELKQERGYVDVCCALIGSTISIDEWNTRPIEDALQAEIDRLKNTLQEIMELARTGLPLADMTGEVWKSHKLNRIAAICASIVEK